MTVKCLDQEAKEQILLGFTSGYYDIWELASIHKRSRRTIIRVLEDANVDPGIKRRHRRTKAELEAARVAEALDKAKETNKLLAGNWPFPGPILPLDPLSRLFGGSPVAQLDSLSILKDLDPQEDRSHGLDAVIENLGHEPITEPIFTQPFTEDKQKKADPLFSWFQRVSRSVDALFQGPPLRLP